MIVPARDIDDRELAVAVAAARARDAELDPLDARRRSRAALRRWSKRPVPPGLSVEGDAPLLVERHRDYVLGSTAGAIRGLDPDGLGRGSLHCVDLGELGVESDALLGIAGPSLFHAARRLLPRTAAPGPCVGVNVGELFRWLAQDDAEERVVVERVRVAALAVGIHEAGHVVAAEVAGDTVDAATAQEIESLPLDAVRSIFRERLPLDQDQEQRRAAHGPTWLRAAAHLTYRAARMPCGDWLADWYVRDCRSVLGAVGADVLDALAPELARSGDEPIVDLVRRDPPPSFVRLLAARAAA